MGMVLFYQDTPHSETDQPLKLKIQVIPPQAFLWSLKRVINVENWLQEWYHFFTLEVV